MTFALVLAGFFMAMMTGHQNAYAKEPAAANTLTCREGKISDLNLKRIVIEYSSYKFSPDTIYFSTTDEEIQLDSFKKGDTVKYCYDKLGYILSMIKK